MSSSSGVEFGDYLTNEYEILVRVFSNLSLETLVTCAEVCTAWRTAAEHTVRNRRSIECLVYDKADEIPPFLCDAELTMLFCSQDLTERQLKHAKKITRQCLICYAKFGLIALSVQNRRFYCRRLRAELPLNRVSSVLCSIRFPPRPGVIIREIIGDKCSSRMNESEIDALLNIPADFQIKAVIAIAKLNVLQNEQDCVRGSIIESNLRKALNCIGEKTQDFALAGGKMEILPNNDANAAGMELIIFGGPKIEAQSCVLDRFFRTNERIKSKIESFSSNVTHSADSVVLVFRCFSRNSIRRRYNYEPGGNVETWENTAIIKNFAETTAIGCYCEGEYGQDYPQMEDATKKPRSKLQFEQEYSTVLLHIVYKK